MKCKDRQKVLPFTARKKLHARESVHWQENEPAKNRTSFQISKSTVCRLLLSRQSDFPPKDQNDQRYESEEKDSESYVAREAVWDGGVRSLAGQLKKMFFSTQGLKESNCMKRKRTRFCTRAQDNDNFCMDVKLDKA